jgi:hypothetical protein
MATTTDLREQVDTELAMLAEEGFNVTDPECQLANLLAALYGNYTDEPVEPLFDLSSGSYRLIGFTLRQQPDAPALSITIKQL